MADETPFWKVLAVEYVALRSTKAATSEEAHAVETRARSWQAIADEFAAVETEADEPGAAPGRPYSSRTGDPKVEARLQSVISHIHAEQDGATALCLSGGGVRSAIFNLGVVQALAGKGLLTKIDYLSTVSGGGYIGSWLSAWAHRHPRGVEGVQDALARRASGLEPANDPAEVRFLREYSNYLTPRVGLGSLDMWTLIAAYLRNLLLNALVLLPAAVVIILIGWAYVLAQLYAASRPVSGVSLPLALFAFALWVISVASAYGLRPSLVEPKMAHRRAPPWLIDLGIVGPAVAWALLASVIYINVPRDHIELADRVKFFATASAIAAVAGIGIERLHRGKWPSLISMLLTFGVFLVCGTAMFALVFWSGAQLDSLRSNHARGFHLGWYAAVAPLVRLGSLFVFVALLVGLTSEQRGLRRESDREWLGRLMGEVLRFGVGHFVLIGLAVNLPLMLIVDPTEESSTVRGGALTIGGLSALIAGFGGLSGRTVALRDHLPRSILGKLREAVQEIAAGVFIASVVVLLSIGIHCLVSSIGDSPETATKKSSATTQPASVDDVDWALPSLVDRPFQNGSADERSFLNLQLQSSRLTASARVEHQSTSADSAPTSRPSERGGVALPSRLAVSMAEVFLSAIAASAIFGLLINVNRFSLHGIYRNRLARTFLGASRGQERRADPFTGFDSEDNFHLAQLARSDRIGPGDIMDLDTAIREIAHGTTPLARHIQARFASLGQMATLMGDPASFVATQVEPDAGAGDPLRLQVAWVLTSLLDDATLWKAAYETVPELAERELQEPWVTLRKNAEEHPGALRLRNRLLLEWAFLKTTPIMAEGKRVLVTTPLIGSSTPKPLPVINAALNLVAGRKLAWQERKAESFTFTPFHSGYGDAYRPSLEYASGVSIATAVAISGAAASPNMGYHSSPLVGMAMTLLNVRLGWWLGNTRTDPNYRSPARLFRYATRRRLDTYHLDSPRWAPSVLFAEAMGRTTDEHPYVYLSDGGHFDNLGLYEMVRRRVRTIVICDASSDPKTALTDFAAAIRKIRIDLGIRIEVDTFNLRPRRTPTDERPSYCGLGKIYYGDVDAMTVTRGSGPTAQTLKGDTLVGHLIYVKPTLRGEDEEPIDVTNFARSSADFPHESTADQWFNESQFESYRTLGETLIKKLIECAEKKHGRVEDFHDLFETLWAVFGANPKSEPCDVVTEKPADAKRSEPKPSDGGSATADGQTGAPPEERPPSL